MAMDERTRQELSQPFGPVMDSINALQKIWNERPPLLVAVGDDTLYRLLQNGVEPDIGVFDLKCRRQPIPKNQEEAILAVAGSAGEVENQPGTVSKSLGRAVDEALLSGRGWIRVDGEDDLAALVFMARSPDGTVILYGQPDAGMVWVEITPELRGRALEMLIKVRQQ